MPNEKKRLIRRVQRKLEKNIEYPNFKSKIKDFTGLHPITLTKLQNPNTEEIKLNPAIVPRSLICNELARFCYRVGADQLKLLTSTELYDQLVKYHGVDQMDISEFRKLLLKLDFVWKKIGPQKVIIMENPVVRFERFEYLTTIKRNRVERYDHIFFIDEIAYNQEMLLDIDESNNLAKHPDIFQQRVIYAVGVKNVTCLNQVREFNAAIFEEWVITRLCSSIDNPSVIVIRGNDHHNAKLKETPTLYSPKHETKEWLDHHNITYDEEMSKYELYKLAEEFTDLETPLYKIDGILKARGHTLLRLPKYLEETNPATLLFNMMKRNWSLEELVKIKTGQDPNVVKSCFMDMVMSAAKSLEGFAILAIAEEQRIINFEKEIDPHLDQLMCQPASDSILDDSDVPSCSEDSDSD